MSLHSLMSRKVQIEGNIHTSRLCNTMLTFTSDTVSSEPPSKEAITVIRSRCVDTHLVTRGVSNGSRQTLVNICRCFYIALPIASCQLIIL